MLPLPKSSEPVVSPVLNHKPEGSSSPQVDYVPARHTESGSPPPPVLLQKTLTTKPQSSAGNRKMWSSMLTNPTMIVAALVIIAALFAAGVGYSLYAEAETEPPRVNPPPPAELDTGI